MPIAIADSDVTPSAMFIASRFADACHYRSEEANVVTALHLVGNRSDVDTGSREQVHESIHEAARDCAVRIEIGVENRDLDAGHELGCEQWRDERDQLSVGETVGLRGIDRR